MLWNIALVAGLLIAGLLIYAASRPDTFSVSRSLLINAPADKIFPHVNDLRAFNVWNPFLKLDPAARLTYSGPASGKGATHEWEGNSNVGKGRFEIQDSTPPSRIVMKLHMLKPMQALNDVVFTFEPKGNATDVTWTMGGRSTFMSKLMGLFFCMDDMVGKSFDKGLTDLKEIVEK